MRDNFRANVSSSRQKLKGSLSIPYAASTDVPAATTDTRGTIIVGDNLKIDETGRLSVDTASVVEKDNTKPITSAAVDVTLGNIDILLKTI